MNIQESRECVRKKLEERQFKPFEFVRTVPAHNPSQRIFDSMPGKLNALDMLEDYVQKNNWLTCFILWNCVDIPQNPQTLSLLELLGLPYLLDSSPVTGERTAIPASPAPPSGKDYGFLDIFCESCSLTHSI